MEETIEEKIEKLRELISIYISDNYYRPNQYIYLINDILKHIEHLNIQIELLENQLNKKDAEDFINYLSKLKEEGDTNAK